MTIGEALFIVRALLSLVKGEKMDKYLIVGAGATGRAVARSLIARHAHVVMVSRSGSGAELGGVEVRPGSATDREFLLEAAQGSTAIFNCLNPKYHQWLTDWPPMADALLDTAIKSGAVLATLNNLYAYGQPDGPMKPTDPLKSTLPKAIVRAQMWRDALAAHERGDVRVTEVRASDFIGSGSQSFFERGKKALLSGKAVVTIGNPDVLHSWTYTEDVGRTLVAAATDPIAWGRPWHAVTNDAKTMRDVFNDMAKAANLSEPKLRTIPTPVLKAIGLFAPQMGELPKTLYQFERPFIIDDSATRAELNLVPTAWDEIIAESVLPKRY